MTCCRLSYERLVKSQSDQDRVVDMRDRDGLTFPEIASRLGRRRSTVIKMYDSAEEIGRPARRNLNEMLVCDCHGACRRPEEKRLRAERRVVRAEQKRLDDIIQLSRIKDEAARQEKLLQEQQRQRAEHYERLRQQSNDDALNIRKELELAREECRPVNFYEIGRRYYLPSIMVREIAEAHGINVRTV